jgi:hypothetical protein
VHFAALAADAAEELRRTVGEHLVHVHVGLRAGARLPDPQRELTVVPAGQHLVRGAHDGGRFLRVELTQVSVGRRGSALHLDERVDDLEGHPFGSDKEILQGALRLSPPEPVGGHFDGTQAVMLDPNVGGGHERTPSRGSSPR